MLCLYSLRASKGLKNFTEIQDFEEFSEIFLLRGKNFANFSHCEGYFFRKKFFRAVERSNISSESSFRYVF